MSLHVEAEVKYAISKYQFETLASELLRLGFADSGKQLQEDHYVALERSILGGYDFERLRKIILVNGSVQYSWDRKYNAKDFEGNKVRMEESRVASQTEFSELTTKAGLGYPILPKERRNLDGKIDDSACTISLDKVNFGEGERYFIEAEIITTVEKGQQAKTLCKQWLQEHLNIDTTIEAPGYIRQYIELVGRK